MPRGRRSFDHLVMTRLRNATRPLREIRYMAGQTHQWDRPDREDILDRINAAAEEVKAIADELEGRASHDSANRRLRAWPQEELELK